jgi:ABC-type dipeptide/oligopeptide/nickel transport system ATPase component
MASLLEIKDLRVCFDTEAGIVRAIHGVSLRVEHGKTLSIVGESGCGKSVTCHSILQLHPPNGRIIKGTILFEGCNLLSLDLGRLDAIRGHEIAMIFQDPMGALRLCGFWRLSESPKPSSAFESIRINFPVA